MKYHGYHVRILCPVWDDLQRARGVAADALSELLGAYHDVVVLNGSLHGNGAGKLQRLIARRRAEIEVLARPIGMRLFAEKPRRIGARHARYWSAWGEEQRSLPSSEDGRVAASA